MPRVHTDQLEAHGTLVLRTAIGMKRAPLDENGADGLIYDCVLVVFRDVWTPQDGGYISVGSRRHDAG